MIWYIFLTLSILFYSITNVTDKIVSNWNNKKFSLVLRYFIASVLSLVLMIVFWEELIFPSLKFTLILMFVWSIYYYVNVIMYKWLQHLNTGIFFMIWYSYLIYLFFINILVFWRTEILSIPKTILAFILCASSRLLSVKAFCSAPGVL